MALFFIFPPLHDRFSHPDTRICWIRNVLSLGDNTTLLPRSSIVDKDKNHILKKTKQPVSDCLVLPCAILSKLYILKLTMLTRFLFDFWVWLREKSRMLFEKLIVDLWGGLLVAASISLNLWDIVKAVALKLKSKLFPPNNSSMKLRKSSCNQPRLESYWHVHKFVSSTGSRRN